LTAEWDLYKWCGIILSDQISSLLDKTEYFHPSVEELGKVAKGQMLKRSLKLR
jgi:hypothetical protein